jgi:hypothetical protein
LPEDRLAEASVDPETRMEVDMTRAIVLAATAMLALGATAYAARGSLPLGPSTTAQPKVFRGF